MVFVAKEKQGQNARNIWYSPSDPQCCLHLSYCKNLGDTTRFTRCNCVPLGFNLQVHLEGEYIKANFNGAVFKESSKAGIGVVLWDSSGQPIAALSACKLPIAMHQWWRKRKLKPWPQGKHCCQHHEWVCKGSFFRVIMTL